MPTDEGQLAELEEHLGYTFKDRKLFLQSLTHPSFNIPNSGKDSKNNQRLEFLGDAVLGLIIAEELHRIFPKQREGNLTRYRSILVKSNQLHKLALKINLGNYIFMSESEEANGGRERASILEDTFESVIGALYLDAGLESTRSIVMNVYEDLEKCLAEVDLRHNPKGRLQESLQPYVANEEIIYSLAKETGPDHEKEFLVTVTINGAIRGSGHGRSKKSAEEEAARQALEWWNQHKDNEGQ